MARFKYAHDLVQGDVILGTDEGRQVHDYPQTSGDVLRVLCDDGVHYMHPATLVMVADPVVAPAPCPAIHGLGHHVARNLNR